MGLEILMSTRTDKNLSHGFLVHRSRTNKGYRGLMVVNFDKNGWQPLFESFIYVELGFWFQLQASVYQFGTCFQLHTNIDKWVSVLTGRTLCLAKLLF